MRDRAQRESTKPMKHRWDEAASIPILPTPPMACQVAQPLRELRGEDFAGGLSWAGSRPSSMCPGGDIILEVRSQVTGRKITSVSSRCPRSKRSCARTLTRTAQIGFDEICSALLPCRY